MSQTLNAIAERIRREGPISFADFMELALYHPAAGFYEMGGAGRPSDFVTSPEIGPLFGAVIARALDAWWRELGEPTPYVVTEAGAGVGTLARSILDAEPACAGAMRYIAVERSARSRAEHASRLPLEPPNWLHGDDTARGPLVASLAELPAGPFAGVVLANELLDNMPIVLLERRGGSWHEVRVGLDDADRRLTEVVLPVAQPLAAEADRLAPDANDGARIPIQHEARRWLASALGSVDRGRVVVIDYADITRSLAAREWTEWLRTYRGHARGLHPLAEPGAQDITCEVAVDQLALVGAPDEDRSQADFLKANGLDGLVRDARVEWQARAASPSLDALRALSRVTEGTAISDPVGLGSFRVLEWVL